MRGKHFFRLIQQCPTKCRQMGLLFLLVLLSLVALHLLTLQSFPNQTASASTSKDAAMGAEKTPLESSRLPSARIAAQPVITRLDVVVVFDVSASMEYQTTCYDCWVRTDPDNPDYPNNGYFNPLPYNVEWADTDNNGTADVGQSIPHSDLCVADPEAGVDPNGQKYLSHEAELYSRNVGDWRLHRRTPGQGFWALQRGSRNINNPLNPAEDGLWQGNQAGNPANQSSNVCHPGIAGNGIECTIEEDDICDETDGNSAVGHPVDCSAYIKAHPFPTYTSSDIEYPKLLGAAYNITCWTEDNCWNDNPLDDPSRPNNNWVPYVEYDFAATWNGDTHIWIRAIGGGTRAYQWNGWSPTTLLPWRDAVIWQVYQGDQTNILQDVTQNSGSVNTVNDWRDNRADAGQWQWLKLGSVSASAGTLRVYQASAGYKIDKLYFTENSNDSQVVSFLNSGDGKGPPATNGSATREACNLCNPAYGYTVDVGDCGCPVSADEARDYRDFGAYGSGGSSCTNVARETNMLENDLYTGLEPLRSAQEAVKNFAKRLDYQCTQLGFVPFTTDVPDGEPAAPRRSKLQCREWAAANLGDPRACYDPEFTSTLLEYSQVIEAIERQWPQASTDIAEGLREGLQELGVEPYAADHNCTPGVSNDSACDQQAPVYKVLILLTDGPPNSNPGNCAPGNGRPDVWNGDVAPDDDDYECAAFYAKEAADAGVILYTIGVGPGINSDLLTLLAEGRDPHSSSGSGEEVVFSTRGGVFFNAATPTDLESIFTQIGLPCDLQMIIEGPETGLVNVAQTFTATITPSFYLPTYTWRATDHPPLTQPMA